MPNDADKLAASAAAAGKEFGPEPAGKAELPCPLKQHWIEIELVGPDGKGVPFEPYQLRLPDRTVLEGKLDEAGFRRVEHLAAGQHRVYFPRQQGPLVEIELLAADGTPAAHEPFVVEDDRGNQRKGILDEHGFAQVGGVVPGECRVSFPERMEQHWLQIQAVDAKGAPAAGEVYRVHAPGGKIIEGALDKDGFAELTGLNPGECEVEFPAVVARWLTSP